MKSLHKISEIDLRKAMQMYYNDIELKEIAAHFNLPTHFISKEIASHYGSFVTLPKCKNAELSTYEKVPIVRQWKKTIEDNLPFAPKHEREQLINELENCKNFLLNAIYFTQ